MLFELYDRDENGTIVKRPYRQGAWLLVDDNGYLLHSTTVPPIKSTNRRSEIRFSAWLESMQKDVECTFGILKGRWRILKTGICLFGVKAADEIFLTCCFWHNWLLEIDGLDKKWENEFLLIGNAVMATRTTALQLLVLLQADVLVHSYAFDTQHIHAITICWEWVQEMMQC